MNLWDDPYGTPVKEFKHGPWLGMVDRQTWNSSPNHRLESVCIECGYRWDQVDFTYRSHPNNPVETHAICWNCWMIDNKPEEVQGFWAHVDRNNSSTFAKPKPEKGLKSLGS